MAGGIILGVVAFVLLYLFIPAIGDRVGRSNGDGIAAAIIVVWLIALCLSLAFWGVVVWGIINGVHYLQRH